MTLNIPNLFFSAAICLVLLPACSKDDSDTNINNGDYSPLTANSTWTYKNNPGTSFTLTATNRDTVANGRTYRVLQNSNGSNYYLGKSGSDYYRFGTIAQVGVSAAEELYLKSDQPVNTTWMLSQVFNAPGIPLPLTANLNYTIKEKGLTRTVEGNSFTNVIHVRLDLSIAGLGTIGGGDFYYAEGVGLIENALNVTVPGQAAINQTQVLTAFNIR